MRPKILTICWLACVLTVSANWHFTKAYAGDHDHFSASAAETIAKGENGGRLLQDGDFTLELALFETGVPPEFRVYVTNGQQKVDPKAVSVSIELIRLGNVVDQIRFYPQDDFLRGDKEIYEPHSFEVVIHASYQGKAYQWRYDNFEGRTQISSAMAAQMNIVTDKVISRLFQEKTKVYGQLKLPPQAVRQIRARFDGEITQMPVALGQKVKKGQWLLTVESNDSLQSYKIFAPIDGVISQQNAGVGEQTSGQALLTITNSEALVAELAIYPQDQAKVSLGANAVVTVAANAQQISTELQDKLPQVNQQQAQLYRANIDNSDGLFSAGQFVSALITTGEYQVEKAVKSAGLQAFRDFSVVYTQVADTYEVRMLELGRTDGEWVEVRSGIELGAPYVSENSYIIKADIEKAGASHDH